MSTLDTVAVDSVVDSIVLVVVDDGAIDLDCLRSLDLDYCVKGKLIASLSLNC